MSPKGIYLMPDRRAHWSETPSDRIPRNGPYDDNKQEVVDLQLVDIARGGFDFVNVVSLWNADTGKPHRPTWMNRYLESTVKQKPQFAILWDNTHTQTTLRSWQRMLAYWNENYIASGLARRFGGQSLITVYDPDLLAKASSDVSAWLDYARKVTNARIFAVCNDPARFNEMAKLGYDGVTGYVFVAGSSWEEQLAYYRQWWNAALIHTSRLQVLMPLTSGWDNSCLPDGRSIANPSPEQFEAGIVEALELERKFPARVIGHTLNAYNEMLEGCDMQVTARYGDGERMGVTRRLFKPDV